MTRGIFQKLIACIFILMHLVDDAMKFNPKMFYFPQDLSLSLKAFDENEAKQRFFNSTKCKHHDKPYDQFTSYKSNASNLYDKSKTPSFLAMKPL